jgi:pyridoxal phosphate enzyme (YggS family)
VCDRIERAARAAGRDPRTVSLVAVSKTFGPDRVGQALAAGQRRFGENYLQEALAKMAEVARTEAGHTAEWHFIGPIQSNKTRELAESFDWVQSLDRLKIAQRLGSQRPADRPALNVLLQVNISGEATKHGVAPSELPALARQVAALARMRELLEGLRGELAGAASDLDTLSMGMSDDLEAAVAEGSTMVRVGTAIFGART